jgi:hypothetical protein
MFLNGRLAKPYRQFVVDVEYAFVFYGYKKTKIQKTKQSVKFEKNQQKYESKNNKIV